MNISIKKEFKMLSVTIGHILSNQNVLLSLSNPSLPFHDAIHDWYVQFIDVIYYVLPHSYNDP